MPEAQQSPGPAPQVRGRAVRIFGRGKGSPVLLLHGNGSGGEEIFSVCPDVSDIAWIAPDRPGYGLSGSPPDGCWDPVSGAAWTVDLIEGVAPEGVTLVAHSMAAGQALIAAARRPDLIRSLVLLAPFCRPTPHRWMPLLRVASRPWLGVPIRYGAVPLAGRFFSRQILARLLASGTVPSWLTGLPIDRLAGGEALISTASELRAFNKGMRSVEAGLSVHVPTCVIWGVKDETAIRDWHLPWLQARVPHLECIVLSRAGHLVHHDAPVTVMAKIVEYSGREASPDQTAVRRGQQAAAHE